MPYEVKPHGKKFVVVNQRTGSPVPGGSHASQAKANAHLQALYANEDDQALQKATWEEGKHPRASNGEFGSGAGSVGSGEGAPKASTAPGSHKESRRQAVEQAFPGSTEKPTPQEPTASWGEKPADKDPSGLDEAGYQSVMNRFGGEDIPHPDELKAAWAYARNTHKSEDARDLGDFLKDAGAMPRKESGLTDGEYSSILNQFGSDDPGDPEDMKRAYAHAHATGDQANARDLGDFLHAMGENHPKKYNPGRYTGKHAEKPAEKKNQEETPMKKTAQPQSQANLFIPLAKIDQEKHQVWGFGAVEEPDVADEIMDYATSLPRFQKWSSAAHQRSAGKSLGNLRSMHDMVASGRLIAFQPNDKKKAIWIGAEVVDPAEWAKVEKGVYTGFSIGGNYAERWWDAQTGKTRYTADPIEISLVDAPCIPSATFQVVKADGSSELRKFAPTNGRNMLKAEMPGSPDPAGEQDLGPVRWDEITVQKFPDPDIPMQVSPSNPPAGETLASRHRGVMELASQIDELLQASGTGEDLRKAIGAAVELELAKASWDESKHKRGEGGKWTSSGAGEHAKTNGGSQHASQGDKESHVFTHNDQTYLTRMDHGTKTAITTPHDNIAQAKSEGEKHLSSDKPLTSRAPGEGDRAEYEWQANRWKGSSVGSGGQPFGPNGPTPGARPTDAELAAHAKLGEAPAAAPKGKPSPGTFDHWKTQEVESPAPATAEHQQPIGEGWSRSADASKTMHQKSAGGAHNDDRTAYITHPSQPGGEYQVQAFDRSPAKSSQEPGSGVWNETTTHPTREAAYAHAEQHLAGNPAPKAKAGPAISPEQQAKNEASGASFTNEGKKPTAGKPMSEDQKKAILANPELYRDEAVTEAKGGAVASDTTPADHTSAGFGPRKQAPAGGAETEEGWEPQTNKKGEKFHQKTNGDRSARLESYGDIHHAYTEDRSTGAGGHARFPTRAEAREFAEQHLAGNPAPAGGTTPGTPEHAASILKGREEDDPSLTPEEHRAMEQHHLANGDPEEQAWGHAAEAHEKEAGIRLPSTAITAMHEHYQKTGKVTPESGSGGTIRIPSSRVRGAGGEVGWNTTTGKHSTIYPGPRGSKGQKQWSVETGDLSTPGGKHPDDGVKVTNFPSQQQAMQYHLNHLSQGKQPVQKVAIRRRPLPALAKRGAQPLQQAPRLIKVNNPRPQPETGMQAPRKVKVSSHKEN